MAEPTPETQEEKEAQPSNIFVAGGDQAVGLAITRLLVKAGHRVTATSSTGTDGAMAIRAAGALPVYPDITRAGEIRSAMTLAKADIVINCTAQSILGVPYAAQDYETTANTFFAGTQALVAVAGQLGVTRIIHISPAFIYSDTGAPSKEDGAISSGNAILNNAVKAEAAVLDGAIAANVLRAGYIYGATSTQSQAVAEKLRKGGFFPASEAKAAFVYEDDVASAIVALLDTEDAPEILNIADNHPTTLGGFLNQLSTIIGVGEPTGLPAFAVNWRTTDLQRVMLAKSTQVDISAIKEAIGWQPEYPTQEVGIERMLLVWRATEAEDGITTTVTDTKAIVKS